MVDGPVFVDQDYTVAHEIVGLGQSRRTESYWTRSTLVRRGDQPHGGDGPAPLRRVQGLLSRLSGVGVGVVAQIGDVGHGVHLRRRASRGRRRSERRGGRCCTRGGADAEERLWCLDGDAPTWAGLTFLGDDGYHKAPFVGAEIDRVGLPGIRFADGPRGAVVGNATAFPVSMARGATWDPDARGARRRRHRPRAARRRGQPDRRGVHQPAAPPGVGSRAGDLRRGPAPRRRARRRADPRPAASRHGLRQALRVQLDGERALHASTSRSTTWRCTRSTCRTSAAWSTRASRR